MFRIIGPGIYSEEEKSCFFSRMNHLEELLDTVEQGIGHISAEINNRTVKHEISLTELMNEQEIYDFKAMRVESQISEFSPGLNVQKVVLRYFGYEPPRISKHGQELIAKWHKSYVQDVAPLFSDLEQYANRQRLLFSQLGNHILIETIDYNPEHNDLLVYVSTKDGLKVFQVNAARKEYGGPFNTTFCNDVVDAVLRVPGKHSVYRVNNSARLRVNDTFNGALSRILQKNFPTKKDVNEIMFSIAFARALSGDFADSDKRKVDYYDTGACICCVGGLDNPDDVFLQYARDPERYGIRMAREIPIFESLLFPMRPGAPPQVWAHTEQSLSNELFKRLGRQFKKYLEDNPTESN